MFEIALPFPCEPIPREHRFGALVRVQTTDANGRLERLTIDTLAGRGPGGRRRGALASVRLAQLRITEGGREQSRGQIHYAPGVTPPPPRPLLNPSISVQAMLLDGQEIVWYWLGDGTYDGWSAGAALLARFEHITCSVRAHYLRERKAPGLPAAEA